jgi:hypothetical protein
MRKGVVPALAIAMTMTAILAARSDDIPILDVGSVCRGLIGISVCSTQRIDNFSDRVSALPSQISSELRDITKTRQA